MITKQPKLVQIIDLAGFLFLFLFPFFGNKALKPYQEHIKITDIEFSIVDG